MSIQKYEAFIKTVETGSLTKAAEALGYTQSGISHMLNSLENEWQLMLLIRDRSGVRLTADGKRLLPTIRIICNQNQELQQQVAELHGLEAGTVRIGSFTSISVQWLPGIIKSFKNEYPHIEFELLHGDYSEIEDWIIQGRVDCGFIALPAKNNLDTIFLSRDQIVAILPPQHPLADLPSFPISAVANEPFIQLYDGVDHEIQRIFDKTFIKPHVVFTAKDDYAIMAMVEMGLGVSLLPELVLQRTPHNIIKKPLDIPAYRNLALASKSSALASPASRRFLEHIMEWQPPENG